MPILGRLHDGVMKSVLEGAAHCCRSLRACVFKSKGGFGRSAEVVICHMPSADSKHALRVSDAANSQ